MALAIDCKMLWWWFCCTDSSAPTSGWKPAQKIRHHQPKKIRCCYFSLTVWNVFLFLRGDWFLSADYVSEEKINVDGVDDFLSVIDHQDMKRRIVITLTLFNGSGFMSFYHWKKYKGGPSMRSWWTENIQFLTYVILCLVKKIHLADIS